MPAALRSVDGLELHPDVGHSFSRSREVRRHLPESLRDHLGQSIPTHKRCLQVRNTQMQSAEGLCNVANEICKAARAVGTVAQARCKRAPDVCKVSNAGCDAANDDRGPAKGRCGPANIVGKWAFRGIVVETAQGMLSLQPLDCPANTAHTWVGWIQVPIPSYEPGREPLFEIANRSSHEGNNEQ